MTRSAATLDDDYTHATHSTWTRKTTSRVASSRVEDHFLLLLMPRRKERQTTAPVAANQARRSPAAFSRDNKRLPVAKSITCIRAAYRKQHSPAAWRPGRALAHATRGGTVCAAKSASLAFLSARKAAG